MSEGYDNIPVEIEAYAAGKRLEALFGRKDLSGCTQVLQ
jgi:hypothetical protein